MRRALLLSAGGLVVACAFGFAARNHDAVVPLFAAASSPTVTSTPVAVLAAIPGNTIAIPEATIEALEALAPPPLVPAATGDAPTARGVPPPDSTSAAVLLLDDASGAVLFERNGHRTLPPASLTKVVTAIIAIEQGDLEATVEVDVDSRTMRGSSVMGLQPGDRFALRDLLYGLMLPSGNDAAIAIARHISGSDAAFIVEMNALMRRLGLKESTFSNPHGLSGVGHSASAYDLAMLSRYALTLPAYREIATADMWTARGSREISMYSLVTEARWFIPGVDAAKSGFTDSAGRTLVASAERDGHRIHVVVMNNPYTEATAAALVDWAFANFDWAQPPTTSSGATAAVPAMATPSAERTAEATRVEALQAAQ